MTAIPDDPTPCLHDLIERFRGVREGKVQTSLPGMDVTDPDCFAIAVASVDGRVWSAGDDANPNRDGDTAELYEPPYLHRGQRPRLLSAPTTIAPRARFTVTVGGASSPSRVTLLAPGATTHALDMNQRFVELRVTKRERTGRQRWRLTVTGPRGLTAAPPGPYMLHALSAAGVPSVARWVRVG